MIGQLLFGIILIAFGCSLGLWIRNLWVSTPFAFLFGALGGWNIADAIVKSVS